MSAILKQKVMALPSMQWVDVGPDLAAKWLERNSQNRPKKPAKIKQYTVSMVTDNWKVTGATIQFGVSGRLLDGQNRLQSIIDSGTTQSMIVVEGLDDDIFDVLDTNATRSGTDMLIIEGFGVWEAATGSAAAPVASQLSQSFMPYGFKAFSGQGVRQYVLEHPSLMDSVAFFSTLRRKPVPLVHSAGAALHFLMAKKDAILADRMMHRFYTGEDLVAGDMLLELRNNLLSISAGSKVGGRGDSTRAIGAFIKVWNAARANRTIKHVGNMFVRSNDAWPEIQ